ncbi:ABC transporter substrate-binding protein [Pleomorphomonas koreensis]|uniref:ABC transporter substrate-binding protein n=1 Tax=Pleomorphomonas koreensis TaxID=257440 RepID=UPI00047E1FBE|nr:ABC transporter substrate-binding protein [Pleomorphomonas koreensis]
MRNIILGVTAAALLGSTSIASAETLTIWWSKGFYAGEDVAFKNVVERFKKENGVDVDLSLYQASDMNVKSTAAVEAGTVPDIAYGDQLGVKLIGKWAYDDKLEDLSDVIEPIEGEFAPEALSAAKLFDEKSGERSYYAFPLGSQTLATMVWTDLLTDAGVSTDDIPQQWEAYWSFWCDKVQPALRAKGKRIYAVGMPYGIGSSDATNVFMAFADAYNVRLVDENGKPRFDAPDLRESLTKALASYTGLYQRGCTPPSSVNWQDPDNNQYMHSRQTVMTFNYSISIPGKWLDDSTNPNLSKDDQAKALDNYQNKLVTLPPPHDAADQPLKTRATYLPGVIFKDSKNKELAKKFLTFLLKDENLNPYIDATKGRLFPSKKTDIDSAFWQSDKHLKAYHGIYMVGTEPWDYTRNYKLSALNNEGVWAKAAGKILTQNYAPDQAADELIADMKRLVQ